MLFIHVAATWLARVTAPKPTAAVVDYLMPRTGAAVVHTSDVSQVRAAYPVTDRLVPFAVSPVVRSTHQARWVLHAPAQSLRPATHYPTPITAAQGV